MSLTRSEKITIYASIIASPLITVVFDLVKSVPVFTTIWNVLIWISDILVSIMTFQVSVWVILIVLIAMFGLLVLYAIISDKQNKNKPGFNFLTYKEDNLVGYRWTWSYTWNESIKNYQVADFKAFCPKCDSPLRFKEDLFSYKTECIRCDFKVTGNIYGDMNRIESLVIDNIERFSKPKIEQVQ